MPDEAAASVPNERARPVHARLDLSILQSLRQIIRGVDLYSRKLYGAHRVTGPQLLALDVLRDAGPLSPAALSRQMHVSPSTVTGIADRLEARELIARRRDQADRRVVRLHLTDEGRRLLLSAPSPLQDRLLRELHRLPELERTAIAMSLQRIVDLMEAEDIDAAPILADGPIAADAPTGQPIDIFLQWTDEKNKPHRVRAQSWVRHATFRFYVAKMEQLPPGVKLPEDSALRYSAKFKELTWYGPMTAKQRDGWRKMSQDPTFQKAIKTFFKESQSREMDATFVFAGSFFYTDEKTGERFYQAEGGGLICVANFPTATIDVAVKSSSTGNENLLYEAYMERIPRVGTDVTVELIPVFKRPTAKNG